MDRVAYTPKSKCKPAVFPKKGCWACSVRIASIVKDGALRNIYNRFKKPTESCAPESQQCVGRRRNGVPTTTRMRGKTSAWSVSETDGRCI